MNKALYFILGLGVGAAGAYFYLREKFDQIAQEEINSVKEAYAAKLDEMLEDTDLVKEPEKDGFAPVHLKHTKPDLMEFSKLVKKEGYTSYATKIETPEDPVHKPFKDEPYEIKADEFGDIEDYEKRTLILYSDEVLADELDDEVFDDVSKIIPDYKDHFGSEDSEAVYVRNDIEQTDYMICKDNRTYKEVTGNEPPSPEETEE